MPATPPLPAPSLRIPYMPLAPLPAAVAAHQPPDAPQLTGALTLLVLLVLASGGWLLSRLLVETPATPLVRDALLDTAALLLFCILALGTVMFAFARSRMPLCALLLAGLGAGMLGWLQQEPSQKGLWNPMGAELAYADLDSNLLTVHRVHHFDYRSESDFTPVYYDQQLDLNQLMRVDWGFSYWGDPDAAHVFLSFVFANGQALSLSLVPRMRLGQRYDPRAGLLRQYPLYALAANERDPIRLRTSLQLSPQEQVYLYQARMSSAHQRSLLLALLQEVNALHEQPEFYNALSNNGTSKLWAFNARLDPAHYPWDWAVLFSGHLPQYLYEQGLLETDGLSFEQLRLRAHINLRSLAAHDDPEFSRKIRQTWPLDYYRKQAP